MKSHRHAVEVHPKSWTEMKNFWRCIFTFRCLFLFSWLKLQPQNRTGLLLLNFSLRTSLTFRVVFQKGIYLCVKSTIFVILLVDIRKEPLKGFSFERFSYWLIRAIPYKVFLTSQVVLRVADGLPRLCPCTTSTV